MKMVTQQVYKNYYKISNIIKTYFNKETIILIVVCVAKWSIYPDYLSIKP